MAALGRPQYINIKREDKNYSSLEAFKRKAANVLDLAYQSDIRYFDTAPGYGMAEPLLIDWLRDNQDPSIEIATKWGYTYVANFDPNAEQHEVKEHSLNKLTEQWQQSQSLRPYLTTYQIHSATLETGVLQNEVILNRLASLKAEHGLLIGFTTTGDKQVDVIKGALEVTVGGVPLFDTFQTTYNILDRSLETVVSELTSRKKRIIIKEALANGRLFPNPAYPHYRKLYQTLGQMADKYDVGIDAIALRFCMDALPSFAVLSGAATEQHLTENLKAREFHLTEHDTDTLKHFRIEPQEYWN